MNWYIGQDIVAVMDCKMNPPRFKKDDTFSIKSLSSSVCNCGCVDINVGISENNGYQLCEKCGIRVQTNGVAWYAEYHFAPLDSLVNISELTEVLNEPIFN